MKKSIVTILNTLFFKATHYQTLGYKIEKFSEKLFHFSLIVLGLCFIGFFVEPFVRHAWFGGIPSGYVFVGIGILAFFVLLSAPLLEDTKQIVIKRPTVLKKHEVKSWKQISGNHDNIDVYFKSFPTLTEFAAMKVGEKYSNWKVTSYTAYNFLNYIFESYVKNYKFDGNDTEGITYSVAIDFEKTVDGKFYKNRFEYESELGNDLLAEYVVNVDETIQSIKDLVGLDLKHFDYIKSDIQSLLVFSISKIEIGRQDVSYRYFGHKFTDVFYVAKVTVDVEASEEFKENKSEIIKKLRAVRELQIKKKKEAEKALSELNQHLL